MKAEDVIGYNVTTVTKATKGKDGYWSVEQTLIQSRSADNSEWETKKVSMRALDKDLNRASDIASTSIIVYLDSIGGDLFEEEDDAEEIIIKPEEKGGYIQ